MLFFCFHVKLSLRNFKKNLTPFEFYFLKIMFGLQKKERNLDIKL